jgi:putative FmdB family regulatory protein
MVKSNLERQHFQLAGYLKMPIYEYRCTKCRRRVDIFVQGFSPPSEPSCTKCGSKELSRIYSSFAVRRSKNDRGVYDEILSDSKLTHGLMRNDPRALAEWSRKMARATGEDVTPESEELLSRLDAGEDMNKVVEDFKQTEMGGDTETGGAEAE